MLLARLALLALLLPTAALAQRETTREALSRLEESLQMRVEDGGRGFQDALPAIVVSTSPAFEETRAWYPTEALASLTRVFGAANLRACEACMLPRLHVEEGRMEQLSTGLGAADIVRMDESGRGSGPPARAAIWLDETPQGVSLRILDLSNGRILHAENFDPSLQERARTHRSFSLARELDRRSRGDSLTHTFFDVTMYPGQHVSLDWAEQWGDGNNNLTGVSVSLYDPVVGVGAVYFRALPQAMNILVGGKLFMSVPTAIVQGISGGGTTVLDPLLNAVFMVRVPLGSATSNYGLTFSASTNGRIGVGLSLMNISWMPFLP